MDGQPNQLHLSRSRAIPLAICRFSFSRSGGPGGQHANKTSTRATLTVLLDDLSMHLPSSAMTRLIQHAGPHLAEGKLVIHSSDTRSQFDNKQACLDKLTALLKRCLVPPRPRHKTKPSRSSIKKRLDSKTKHSKLKRSRQRPNDDA